MKKFSEAQSAFYKALEFDNNNSEALEGLSKCRQTMQSGMSQKERAEAAMKDPEVQVRLSYSSSVFSLFFHGLLPLCILLNRSLHVLISHISLFFLCSK